MTTSAQNCADGIPVQTLRAALWPRDIPHLQRYGRHGDGGYVLPADVMRRAGALLSCGLGMEWSFERAFAAEHPLAPIHVYDASVGPARFLMAGLLASCTAPFSRHSRRRMHACVDYFRFFRGAIRHQRQHVDGQSGSVNLQHAVSRFEPGIPLLLKIDIEGGEYALLPAIVRLADRFVGVVLELHDTPRHVGEIARFVEQLARTHIVAHLHGNNYAPACADGGLTTSVEVVFVVGAAHEYPPYPHDLPRPGLDAPNTPRWPDVVITRV